MAVAWHGSLAASPSAVQTSDVLPDADPERGLNRVASIAVLIGIVASVIAGATIWLLLTDPVTVATSVDEGQLSPLLKQLGEVIYDAIAALLRFL